MSLYVSVDTQVKNRMDVFVQFYECLSILCCKNTSDCNICYSIKCLVLHCVQDVISPCPSSPPRKLANLPSNILPVPLCRAAAARRHKGSQFNNLQFSCSQWSACAWSPVTTLTHTEMVTSTLGRWGIRGLFSLYCPQMYEVSQHMLSNFPMTVPIAT